MLNTGENTEFIVEWSATELNHDETDKDEINRIDKPMERGEKPNLVDRLEMSNRYLRQLDYSAYTATARKFFEVLHSLRLIAGSFERSGHHKTAKDLLSRTYYCATDRLLCEPQLNTKIVNNELRIICINARKQGLMLTYPF